MGRHRERPQGYGLDFTDPRWGKKAPATKNIETVAVSLGALGFVLVMWWPGAWWTLLPWILGNPLMGFLCWRKGLKSSAGLFIFYAMATAMGLVRWIE